MMDLIKKHLKLTTGNGWLMRNIYKDEDNFNQATAERNKDLDVIYKTNHLFYHS